MAMAANDIERLIRAGRENLGRFSWDKAARQYETVFRRALSLQARPAVTSPA